MDTTMTFHKLIKAYTDGNELIVMRGGTSSGKSYAILELLILIAHKHKVLISVVSETWPHLSKGCYHDFLEILKGDDLYDERFHNKTEHSYQFLNGKIEFFSCDSPSKVHGPRRDILFINEAVNISYEIFTQLDVRTDKCTIIDFNPCHEFWLQDIPPTEKMVEIVTTYKDNKFLSQKIIKGIEAKQFTHPDWWKVYGLGEYGIISETIFTNWKQCDKIPIDAKLIGFSTDFGFTNDPTAVVEVRMQDGAIYLKELVYETGLTNRDISKKYEEVGICRGMDDIIADCAEPKSIHELRQAGWNVHPSPKGPDSIIKGLDIMMQYQIFITAESINLIKEFRMYRWQRDKISGKMINKPIGGLAHGIDGVRYVCLKKLNKKKRFLKQWN